MLKITNNNGFDLQDRYDGQDYFFPKGKTVACEDAAARHIFGVGEQDKKPYLTRLGWLQSTGEFDEAMQKLNNFSFEYVEMKLDVEFARIEHGQSPHAIAEAEGEDGADESSKPSVSAPKPRNILKRLEQAPA